MRTLEHPTLGEVEVIVEVMHKMKHFFLVKGNSNHYCLWGNINDIYKMGTNQILTKNGNKPRLPTINKYFFEMINTSEKLTFEK